MRRIRKEKNRISSVLPVLLLGVFSACVLIALIAGARVYSSISAENGSSFDSLVCTQFIRHRVSGVESPAEVSVGEYDGSAAVFLSSREGDEKYVTCLYCSGGFLRELYAPASVLSCGMPGEIITEATALEASIEGNLLEVYITLANGEKVRLLNSVTGREAVG